MWAVGEEEPGPVRSSCPPTKESAKKKKKVSFEHTKFKELVSRPEGDVLEAGGRPELEVWGL